LGLQACEKSGISSLQGKLGSYCILVFVLGPFAARGAKGEEEYLYHWLGGTGEVSLISMQENKGAQDFEGNLHFTAFVGPSIFIF
jgi:hypothetical protein